MSHNYYRFRPDNESVRGRLTSAWLHYWRELERRVLKRKPTVHDYHFPKGSSGPFGEETPGAWEPLEAVAYNWLHFKLGKKKRGTLNPRGWFDFHATILPSGKQRGWGDERVTGSAGAAGTRQTAYSTKRPSRSTSPPRAGE
jgi:hypothetical protein